MSLTASFSALLYLPGKYNATLTSSDNSTPAMNDQLNVTVSVPTMTCNSNNVNIRDLDVPSSVEKGRIEQITVSVRNEKNNDQNVKVRVWLFDSNNQTTVAFGERTENINDNEDEEVDVDLNVPSNLDDTHSFTIFAQAIDDTNLCDLESQTADVVASGGGGDSRLCDGGGLDGDIRITDVECDGDDCDDQDFDSSDEFDVDIEFENRGNRDLDEVTVQAWICEDDEFCDIDDRDSVVDDEEDIGNLDSDDSDDSTLTLDLNDADIDEDNDYFLHVRVFDDDRGIDEECDEEVFDLDIEEERDDLTIDDVEFENLVCGQRARVIVTLENNGQRDQNDVKVSVSVTGANIADESEEFDLDSDDRRFITLDPLIPADIEAKPYTFNIRARSDDTSDSETFTQSIQCAATAVPLCGEGRITSACRCEGATRTSGYCTEGVYSTTAPGEGEEEEGGEPSRQGRVANVLTPRQVRVGVPARVSVSSQLEGDEEFTFTVSGADANVEPSRALLSPQVPFDIFVMVDPNEETEGLVLTMRAQGTTQNEQFNVVGQRREEEEGPERDDTSGGVVTPPVEEEPRPNFVESARGWIVPAAIGIAAAIVIVVIVALLL